MSEMQVKVLFSAQEIQQRIKELARDICLYYQDTGNDFRLLYLEKGARIFALRLYQEICGLEGGLDICKGIMSITAKRTNGAGFMDEVSLSGLNLDKLRDKHILLVEDIIDQGITLHTVIKRLENVVSSVKVCVLVNKTQDRKKTVRLDYVGFCVSGGWALGLGMDIEEYGRNLPYIGLVDT